MFLIRAFAVVVLLLQTEETMAHRSLCVNKKCYKVFEEKINFQESLKICKEHKGTLMSINDTSNEVMRDLLLEVKDVWITLRVPLATRRLIRRNKITDCESWSVSSGLILKKKSCQDTANGFICEYYDAMCKPGTSSTCSLKNADCEHHTDTDVNKPACFCKPREQDATAFSCRCKDGFKMNNGRCEDVNECSNGPCEHYCTNTAGSFHCTCMAGYIPSKVDHHRCEQYCNVKECPAICDLNSPWQCTCPNGYIVSNETGHQTCINYSDSDDNAPSPSNEIRASSCSVTPMKGVLVTFSIFPLATGVFL